jgi:hypothetical protein
MKSIICALALLSIFLALPVFSQEPEKPTFGAVGISIDQTAEKSLAGWGALGIPVSDRVVSFTDFDVSVIRGTTWQQALKNEGVQYTIRTGFAFKLFSPLKGVSIWGLGDAGVAAGGPEGYTGQTVVSGSYAGGGFVHVGNERVGGLLILQVDQNAATGRSFIPRIGVRVKL